MEPQAPEANGGRPPVVAENDAYRNATPENVRLATKEKEAVYSRIMDEIISSRGEKGQYFAVFGKPTVKHPDDGYTYPEEPDGRFIIFSDKVPTDETSSYVGLNRDGFFAIPENLTMNGAQDKTAGSVIEEQIKKQIDAFYSSADRSGADEYPMRSEYDDMPTRFNGPAENRIVKKNGYMKDAERWRQPGERVLSFGKDNNYGNPRELGLSFSGEHYKAVDELDDMEVVKQVISSSQEKARSPHEASAIEAKQRLEQAQDMASFIRGLPPKA